jgi:hypothetical protein
MSRKIKTNHETMKVQKWLTISRSGTAKISVNRPYMAVDEIAILLSLDIPDMLFAKPKLVAEIKVPDTAVTPEQVTTEVTDNIEEAIKSVTGLEMRVSVVDPEEGGAL